MAHTLLVDKLHAQQNLPHKVLNVVHWNELASLFSILYDLFKVLVAEFEHQVLHDFPLLVLRVVNVE